MKLFRNGRILPEVCEGFFKDCLTIDSVVEEGS